MVWIPDWKWNQQQQKGGGKGKGGGGFQKGGGWGVQRPAFQKAGSWGAQQGNQGGGGERWKKASKVDPAKTVWVGNIPEGVDFKTLKAHCEQAGPCKWAEVYEGKGKGTGAIGFASASECETAIAVLNGSFLNGQALECDSFIKSEKKKSSWTPRNNNQSSWQPRGGKGFGKNKVSKIDGSKTIWVGNIAEGVDFKVLKAHCEQAGPVKWAEVYQGKGKGTGAVGYASTDEAAEALSQLNGSLLNGQAIQCDAWEKPAR